MASCNSIREAEGRVNFIIEFHTDNALSESLLKWQLMISAVK